MVGYPPKSGKPVRLRSVIVPLRMEFANPHTMLQFMDIEPDEVPIFVSQNVFADALAYHDAISVPTRGGGETLQTLIYTSWLDGAFVGICWLT